MKRTVSQMENLKTTSSSTIEVYCQECGDECDPAQQMCGRCKRSMWWDGSLVMKLTPIEKKTPTPATQLPIELSFSSE